MHESPPDRWRVLAVVCAALVVVVIDVTVLHVAAPAITEDLQPSAVGLLWIIDVYPLVVAPLLVATGTLGDRLGRRRMLVAGMVVFGIASGLCAFAPTTAALIAARALMGVGGAMIMPSTMSIVRDVFRDRRERVRAVGIWSATLAAGAAVGPLVGGFLVEHFWWGSVFLVNVPVLALVLPFALRILPESRAEDPPPWDLPSIVMVAAGVLGLAFGIKHGARHGFGDPLALATLTLAVALLFAFTRRQLRMPDPVLDVRLFASTTFSVAVGCVVLSMFGLVGLELFFAQYLQLVLGLEPLAAALRLMPLAAATLAGSLLAARLLHGLGTRIVVGGGLTLTTVAMVPLLWLGVDDSYIILWPPLVAMGFGLEIALVAANDAIISAVSADRAGGAAAIEETAYELGGGLGVAVLGSIVTAGYTANLTAVPGVPDGEMTAAQESLGRAAEVAAGLPAAVGDPLVELAQTAFVDGLHLAIAVSIVLLGASALLAATLLSGGGGGREEPEDDPGATAPGPQRGAATAS
jgi:MFS transporter, DHA2 family, multidrug resistance protein